MARGTFANIRLVNKLVTKPGPRTLHVPSGDEVVKHSILSWPVYLIVVNLSLISCFHCVWIISKKIQQLNLWLDEVRLDSCVVGAFDMLSWVSSPVEQASCCEGGFLRFTQSLGCFAFLRPNLTVIENFTNYFISGSCDYFNQSRPDTIESFHVMHFFIDVM